MSKYPNEVTAFVGIDSSVPTQPGMDVTFPMKKFVFLKQSGLMRLIMKLGPDPYAALAFDDHTKEQMKLITNKNSVNATLLNEMEHISSNFKGAQDLTFPKDLPLLLFVQADNPDFLTWIPLHEEQVKDSDHGKVIPLEGEHYLHHNKYKDIAETFSEFSEEVKGGPAL